MNETRHWKKIWDGRFARKKSVDQRQQYVTKPFNSIFGSHFHVWVSYIIKGDRNDFEPENEGWFFYFYNNEREFFGFKGPFASSETAMEASTREVVYDIQRIYDLIMSYRIADNGEVRE
jgi:hypothetical protein